MIVANTAKNALAKKNPVLFTDVAVDDEGEEFIGDDEDEDIVDVEEDEDGDSDDGDEE